MSLEVAPKFWPQAKTLLNVWSVAMILDIFEFDVSPLLSIND
jgi:hypothetical protein